MPTVSDRLREIYVLVDGFLKTHHELARRRHSPNDASPFTDSEMLTVALMQFHVSSGVL